jgi:uncharacterized OB-fold protein
MIADESGKLVLPCCRDCGTVQYPLRELCRNCLADSLEWVPVSGDGILLSWTDVHASLEPFFAAHTPWPVGRAKLACGPVVIAHLGIRDPRCGIPVHVRSIRDAGGAVSFVILPEIATHALSAPIGALRGSNRTESASDRTADFGNPESYRQ